MFNECVILSGIDDESRGSPWDPGIFREKKSPPENRCLYMISAGHREEDLLWESAGTPITQASPTSRHRNRD
jgi:hypothetical protein